MKNKPIVWCRTEERGWWPAEFVERIECVNTEGLFYLNQV